MQYTCKCKAYDFPHRIGGGRCNGIWIVEENAGGGECKHCHLNSGQCEVLAGMESVRECPYVIEFTNYHEVSL